ncbi:hypothetical protein ABT097_08000 [Streptomyces sp. NPDC002225]|uniref:hypothetical protein n=1 Tax=Streptomyces sp. NPDC002225 TaxID=3154413 RepID=UPI003319749C
MKKVTAPGPYSATTFANLALTESLHLEMRMRGAPVQVSVVNPGSVKSEIFSTARTTETATSGWSRSPTSSTRCSAPGPR